MNPYAIPSLMSGLLYIGLGAFIYLKNRQAKLNQTFSLLCLVTFIWQFTWTILFNVEDTAIANLLIKIGYSGIIFIPFVYYHFITRFLDLNKQRNVRVLYFFGLLFLVIHLISNRFVNGFYHYFWGYYPRAGTLHIFYLAVLMGCAIAISAYLKAAKRQPVDARRRDQIRYITLSFAAYCAASLDFLANYGIGVYPVGFLFILVSLGTIAYSIVKHHLLDITVIIKKTFSYSLLLLLLIVPSFIALILAEKYLPSDFQYPALACLFVAVGFLYPKIRFRTERNLANILFQGTFDYRESLDKLSKKMATLQNLKDLLSDSTTTIAQAMDTDSLGTYLLEDGRHYELKAWYGRYKGAEQKIIGLNSPLVQYLQDTDDILRNYHEKGRTGSSQKSPALKELDLLGGHICIPIKFERELTGFLVLGEKESAGDYSKEELHVVSTMTNQLAVAVENSKTYEEIKELNLNLEEIVKQRTAELRKVNEELKQLDTMKSDFFSNVSHELRTPLTNIILPLQHVLDELGASLDPDNFEEKKIMLRNAHKLLKRINEILDISKLEAGKMTIQVSPRDINSILDDIVATSSIGAREMGIELVFTPDPGLPEVHVDTEKIEKVFSNLVSNALKFTNRGGTVSVTTGRTEHFVEVMVSDTGIGIAEADLAHIFDRFHQVDSSSARKYEGTGLGLCLVKEFLALHQGTVDVKSEPGQGTAFTVRLRKGRDHFKDEQIDDGDAVGDLEGLVDRRQRERRRQERRESDRRRLGLGPRETIDLLDIQLADLIPGKDYEPQGYEREADGEPEGDHKINEKTVLIVEDNRDLAANIAKMLDKFYDVHVTYNGREALESIGEDLPDLIISDVMMPEMDGYELCRRIRANEKTRYIPVLILTARVAVTDKVAGLEQGADYYLGKPFHPRELKAVVDSLISRKELQVELNRTNLALKKALQDLEETQVKLVHTARLEAVGQLAAGISHEIKNNIYCVRAGLDGFGKRLAMIMEGKLNMGDTYGSLIKALETNSSAIERSLYIVNSLLDFSRKNKEGMAFSDINQGIESTVTIVLPKIKDKVTIHKEYGAEKKVECKVEEINQVVMNMLINAHQAMEGKGNIWIKTYETGEQVGISIADDGPGIAEENLGKIFLPFFSTKEKGVNSGLGLSISHNIIKNHNGTIEVKSAPGKGTEFIITLPARQPKSAAAENMAVANYAALPRPDVPKWQTI